MVHDYSRRRFIAGLGVLGAGAFSACLNNEPTVLAKLDQGVLHGTIRNGLHIYKGVPYAKPPVGAKRFLPPEQASPWQGVRDARNYAPAPVQPSVLSFIPDRLFLGAPTSEDCLYLNIWQPKTNGPHPVVVWIHGGGNIAGAASQIVDGSLFAENGIVCVTVGYRLGAFGFLELGNALGDSYRESSANGLKDQIAALKWIQHNIAIFSGDPDRVTVFGASAGGKNIVSLLAAPQAKGLFASAIVQSGGQTIHDMESAEALTRQFSQCLKDLGADPAKILSLPAGTLNKAQTKLLNQYPRPFPFRTVVGTSVTPIEPLAGLVAGASTCRLLIGTSRDEAITFIGEEAGAAPISAKHLSNINVDTANTILKGYATLFPELSLYERKIRFLTAEEYFIPSLRIANALRKHSDVWMYQFAQEATAGPSEGWVAHGSDAPYIWNDFDNFLLNLTYGKVPESARGLADDIFSRWCAFIKGGAPNSNDGVEWPKFDGGKILKFENNRSTVFKLNSREIALWENISL
ncbi:carboxylesterase/lipase family protein [Zhongshania sp.]|uniref:carboxylesterase/lipase family protein n=1 Tax=Zhongshania sp. TaxID=1971902 RepID=UPI0035685A82